MIPAYRGHTPLPPRIALQAHLMKHADDRRPQLIPFGVTHQVERCGPELCGRRIGQEIDHPPENPNQGSQQFGMRSSFSARTREIPRILAPRGLLRHPEIVRQWYCPEDAQIRAEIIRSSKEANKPSVRTKNGGLWGGLIAA
jgi:hypothetical protein